MTDNVNHPSHYAEGWSNGAEVIDITENLNFCRGNAVKYIARAGKKDSSKELEDLRKAEFYLKREIALLETAQTEDLEREFDDQFFVNHMTFEPTPREWELLEDVPRNVRVTSKGNQIWTFWTPETSMDRLGFEVAKHGEWMYSCEGRETSHYLYRTGPFTEVIGTE